MRNGNHSYQTSAEFNTDVCQENFCYALKVIYFDSK